MPEDSENFDPVDRPRGILTREDRKYLLGELDRELDENARAQRIYRIRQRVRNSVLDFRLLSNCVEDTWQAFQGESEGMLDTAVKHGIISAFEYFERMLGPESRSDDWGGSTWRLGVVEAIVAEYALQGVSVLPRVEIDINTEDRVPLSTVKSAFENGEGLVNAELRALLKSGEVTRQQYGEWWDDRPVSEDGATILASDYDSVEQRRERNALDSE